MNYKNKYLKYKSKYLYLKNNKLNNLIGGGTDDNISDIDNNILDNNILDIDKLTDTPNFQSGGYNSNFEELLHNNESNFEQYKIQDSDPNEEQYQDQEQVEEPEQVEDSEEQVEEQVEESEDFSGGYNEKSSKKEKKEKKELFDDSSSLSESILKDLFESTDSDSI